MFNVENEVRDLLYHAGEDEIGAELLCKAHVATAAGLQIAAVRRSIDRRDVDDLKLAGIRRFLAQLIACPCQPVMLVRAGSIHLALQAGIDQLEIEHCDFRRIGACLRCDHECEDERQFHDHDAQRDAYIRQKVGVAS